MYLSWSPSAFDIGFSFPRKEVLSLSSEKFDSSRPNQHNDPNFGPISIEKCLLSWKNINVVIFHDMKAFMEIRLSLLVGIFSFFTASILSFAENASVPPATAATPAPAQTNASFSRFGISAEFLPGIINIVSLKDSVSTAIRGYYYPLLGGDVGFSIYTLNQCGIISSTCLELPIHIRVGAIRTLEDPSAQVFASGAIEPTLFFGHQRKVGFTIQAVLGYRYQFSLEEIDGNRYSNHSVYGQASIGALFRLGSAMKGAEIYLRAEIDTNVSFLVPIGVRYRF